MDDTRQKKALRLARFGFVVCLGATAVGTLAWMNGNFYLWGVNCAILTLAGACTLLNYKIAGH